MGAQQEPLPEMQEVFCLNVRTNRERGYKGKDSARQYKVVAFQVSVVVGLECDQGAYKWQCLGTKGCERGIQRPGFKKSDQRFSSDGRKAQAITRWGIYFRQAMALRAGFCEGFT